MAAPTSARPLPAQYPNSSVPVVDPETGLLSAAWRYIFSLFAVRTSAVNPNFSQTIDVAYNQAQIQALSDQVAALSKQLGQS